MTKTIVYLISGPAYLPYLVCSLHRLRQIWDGPVIVTAWPESIYMVGLIENDKRLQIKSILRHPAYRGKNGQFLDKIRLMQNPWPGDLESDEVNLYLDADTLPQRADVINRLFQLAETAGFCATQFNRWTTKGRTIGKRVRKLIGCDGIDQAAVKKLINGEYPSVNGGVFACRPDSPVLPLWEKWTESVVSDMFIADEVCLHAVMAKYMSSADLGFDVAVGGKFNCSLKHQPTDMLDEDVGIWHGHGDCFVRPNKSLRGVDMWWPVYQHCLAENIGGIADWKDEALAVRNSTARYIKKLEAQQTVVSSM